MTKRYRFPEDPPVITFPPRPRAWHFRWPQIGWAIFTVNDATGEFTIQSDWGDWSHRWNASSKALGAPTLTHFLSDGTGPDYVINKFCYNKGAHTDKVFDDEATWLTFRKMILKMRTGGRLYRSFRGVDDGQVTKEAGSCGVLDKDPARYLWDQAEEWCRYNSGSNLDWAYSQMDDDLSEFLWHEPWNYVQWCEPTCLAICRNELLPRFFKYLVDHVVHPARTDLGKRPGCKRCGGTGMINWRTNEPKRDEKYASACIQCPECAKAAGYHCPWCLEMQCPTTCKMGT